MNYNLTKPCSNCPFRSDKPFPLAEGRVEEILDGLFYYDQPFSCHKTTTSKGKSHDDPGAEHCAGALILLEKNKANHQMMRIAERLGMYDYKKLDMDSPVYDTYEEMVEGCSKADRGEYRD